MRFKKLFESLEDERDLLLAAGDYKCRLTRYDMEEASDWNMLLEYIKDSFNILKDEFGDNIKMWSFYEDDNIDMINGYKVWLTDGTKHIVEINNDRVDIVEGYELTEESSTKFIIVAVTNEGTRLFYNSTDDNFVTSAKAATIYDEHDVAIADWHKIDKTQFKRVFVPNYDPKLFESYLTDQGSVSEDYTRGYEPGAFGDRIFNLLDKMSGDDILRALKEYKYDEVLNTTVEMSMSDIYDKVQAFLDTDSGAGLYNALDKYCHWNNICESKSSAAEGVCCICNEPIVGYGNNAEPVCSGRCCDRCNIEKVIPARLEMLNDSEDEYETDYRYYVYANEDDVVGDEFEYDEDAIEWAKDNGYPIVKIHNYYRDERGKLQPDGYPEVIWTAE